MMFITFDDITQQISKVQKLMRSDSQSPEISALKPHTLEEEKIPQSKKYNNERLDKEYQINVNLIAETSLDNSMTNALSQQEIIQMVLELRSIHLEWLNIKKIENLQVFEKLTVLYLQHNKIRKIQHLDCLKNLQYLALNDNFITKVQNLNHLTKLQGLNLTNNNIEDVQVKQFPQNIQLLSLKNNPITLDANYKKDLIKGLKVLEVLDDIVISPQEKVKAIGKFPLQLVEYSQQMNQFRRKKEMEKNLKEQSKPILLGGERINEKEAESQIRQKTRKYLYENKQTFKHDQQEQIQNFEEKIIVSRNIRHIKEEQERSRKERLDEIKAKKMLEIDREIDQIRKAVKNQGFGKEKIQEKKV